MGIFLSLLLLVVCAPYAMAGGEPVLIAYRTRDTKHQSAADSAIIWNNRGVDLFSDGKYKQAVQAYDRALKINRNYTDAYSNRGVVFDAMNLPARAIKDYSQAIRLNPNFLPSYNNRAAAYCELGKFNESILDWNKVLGRTPRDGDAYYRRGFCYQSLNKLPEALADYESALRCQPRMSKALKGLDAVKAALRANSNPPAMALTKEKPLGAASVPVLPASSSNQPAIALTKTGQKTRPVDVVRQSFSTHDSKRPHEPQLAAQAQAPVSLTPAAYCASAVRHVLGNVCVLCGQYNEAIRNFTAAIVADPGDQFAYYRRGNAYRASGRFSEAMADYDRALRLNPRFKQAKKKRELLLGRSIPHAGEAAQ